MIRKIKMLFTKSGSGSVSTRLSIPVTWVRAMGITENERDVKIEFDGEKITITKENN